MSRIDSLEEKIRAAINNLSLENNSNTPDFVLARYLISCLDAFEVATRERDAWYDIEPKPGATTRQF